MRHSHVSFKRLLFGLSVEDAHSKFSSPESRALLRLSHERHNKGIYHELEIAKRQRDRLSSEQKCNITRFTKPSVSGFQGYTKSSPKDYAITELWPTEVKEEAPTGSNKESEVLVNDLVSLDLDEADATNPPDESAVACSTQSIAPLKPTIGKRLSKQRKVFQQSKQVVLKSLESALDLVSEHVMEELRERRQKGSLVGSAQQSSSVVDRLVGDSALATDLGYKTLSSSTHLLESVEMSLALFARKEKNIAAAFDCASIVVPAKEGGISYSLWVSGGLIAHSTLQSEFPFHVAKFVMPEGAAIGSRVIPKVQVEVYFSPDLFQLHHTVGKDGLAQLRHFIGHQMMRQHEPTPSSADLFLLTTTHVAGGIHEGEHVRIPWLRPQKSTVAALTGVVMETTESVLTEERMRDAISYVWRVWGHLVKDLHVHADLDFLYVCIDRQKEMRETQMAVQHVKEQEEQLSKNPTALVESSSAMVPRRGKKVGVKAKPLSIPVATDFVVVECTLERRGLPHNLVVEDITTALVEMQREIFEMQRLALLDELRNLVDDGLVEPSTRLVPVVYAPKVVVSHAGVIENGTVSSQRIRIRGSTFAHVNALMEALRDGEAYFTDRSFGGLQGSTQTASEMGGAPSETLPANLAFSRTHAPENMDERRNQRRMVGHVLPNSSRRSYRHQSSTAYDHLVVTEDERHFWREHNYCLANPRIIFEDRVDSTDVAQGLPRNMSTQLKQHLELVSSKLTADEEEEENNSSTAAATVKRKRKKKIVDAKSLPLEKLFECLCTDVEAHSATYDLRIGDCSGYDYRITVRKIPSRDTPKVAPAMRSLCSKGFINYFGSTRFASYTKMNMHPGLHLLKGEFRAAANIIVQQFYVDAAMAAERRLTGSAFPTLKMPMTDFTRGGASRRSVGEKGTAMQRVLHNALQAATFLDGEAHDAKTRSLRPSPRGNKVLGEDTSPVSPSTIDLDPCAEAFLHVIGPKACQVMVHEFLSFLWNDIVNQRFRRYGTFAILPGDLVVPRIPSTGSTSVVSSMIYDPQELVHASRRDIEQGIYSHWDMVLPVPGAHVRLPDNHTSDLYVAILKRWGLAFDPESLQWPCFFGGEGQQPGLSPYLQLTPSYDIMEAEVCASTPFSESLDGPSRERMRGSSRPDLELMHRGNSLHTTFTASYRHPLVNPSSVLQWSQFSGARGDPHQRWGHSLKQALAPRHDASSGLIAHSSSSQPQLVMPATPQFLASARTSSGPRNGRRFSKFSLPAAPYWLPQNNEGYLDLRFTFPTGVYASSMLRELLKSDVSSSDVVALDKPTGLSMESGAQEAARREKQQEFMMKRRKRAFAQQPRAISLALLHQHIFRSGGIRQSLIPTMRSYDSVSK